MNLNDENEIESFRKEGIEKKFDYLFSYISSKVRIVFTLFGFCVTSIIFLFSFSRQYKILREILIIAPFVLFLAISIFICVIIRLSKIEDLMVSVSDIPYILKGNVLEFVEKSKRIYNILIILGGMLFWIGVTLVLYELLADIINWIYLISFSIVFIVSHYESRNVKKAKVEIAKKAIKILSEMAKKKGKE